MTESNVQKLRRQIEKYVKHRMDSFINNPGKVFISYQSFEDVTVNACTRLIQYYDSRIKHLESYMAMAKSENGKSRFKQEIKEIQAFRSQAINLKETKQEIDRNFKKDHKEYEEKWAKYVEWCNKTGKEISSEGFQEFEQKELTQKKVKIVVKKKSSSHVEELKTPSPDDIYKNTVTNIKFLKESEKWELTLGDSEKRTVSDLLRFLTLPDVHLAEYYQSFIENYKLIKEEEKKKAEDLMDENWLKKELWELSRDDKAMEEAYDFFYTEQALGKYPGKDFILDVDAVFYDDFGNLKGFNVKDSKVLTKQQLQKKYTEEAQNLLKIADTDVQEALNNEKIIASVKNEEDRDVQYYLVQSNRKVYLVPKDKVESIKDDKKKILEGLSDNWENELKARTANLEKLYKKYLNHKKVGTNYYEFQKYNLLDLNGNVIKSSTGGKILDKEVPSPIVVSSGKLSHHSINEKKTRDDTAMSKEDTARLAEAFLEKADAEWERVEKQKEKLLKVIERAQKEFASKLSAVSKVDVKTRPINKVFVNKTVKNVNLSKIVSKITSNSKTTQLFPENNNTAFSVTTPTQGVYLLPTGSDEMFTICEDNELKNLIHETLSIQTRDVPFEQAFKNILSKHKEEPKITIPTYFYKLNQPDPRIAKRYLIDEFYGCYYAAVKFFLYVSNTPLDERYTYTVTVPAHEKLKRKRVKMVKYYNHIFGTPVYRSIEDVEKDAKETVMVPEKKYKKKHKPDQESVRGDWVMTFRGVKFKAFKTEPSEYGLPDNSDYTMYKSWFDFNNKRLFTLQDAEQRAESIEKIAKFLYEKTHENYKPVLNENGIPIFEKESFDCPMTNLNPRWEQLEKGTYVKSLEQKNTGPKHYHGTTGGYSFQAPQGFIKRTDEYISSLTQNKSGNAKMASTLINRFVTTYRSKSSNFETYYKRWIEPSFLNVTQKDPDFKNTRKFTKDEVVKVK